MVLLKHLNNFGRTIVTPLINCEINFILTWTENVFIIDPPANNQVPTCTTAGTTFYVPGVTLSTQGNAKLLQQLKSGLKRTINWNKDQSKVTIQERNRYLDSLIHPIFKE